MSAAFGTLHRSKHHFGWDRALAPALHIQPGQSIQFEVADASGGQLTRQSTRADVATLDTARVNPVTGPVFVEGASPGDTLLVEIGSFTGSGWGWTAIIPGFGLLADEFPAPYLHISHYDDRRVEFTPDIHLPTRAFPGTIGVVPAAPGPHSVIPPRAVGGNMDFRDLVQGAKVHLPVQVPGALFSVGDTHAAQGDGEVCGTAIETPMTVELRFEVRKQTGLRYPEFELPPRTRGDVDDRGHHVTCGIGPDLMQASRDAIRAMIDHLGRHHGLAPELAYCLCSVAVDLRITEIVDAPNWMVAAYLPRAIFR